MKRGVGNWDREPEKQIEQHAIMGKHNTARKRTEKRSNLKLERNHSKITRYLTGGEYWFNENRLLESADKRGLEKKREKDDD